MTSVDKISLKFLLGPVLNSPVNRLWMLNLETTHGIVYILWGNSPLLCIARNTTNPVGPQHWVYNNSFSYDVSPKS